MCECLADRLGAAIRDGRVVELVDSLDSGSSVHCGRAGSSPASPTKEGIRLDILFFVFFKNNT